MGCLEPWNCLHVYEVEEENQEIYRKHTQTLGTHANSWVIPFMPNHLIMCSKTIRKVVSQITVFKKLVCLFQNICECVVVDLIQNIFSISWGGGEGKIHKRLENTISCRLNTTVHPTHVAQSWSDLCICSVFLSWDPGHCGPLVGQLSQRQIPRYLRHSAVRLLLRQIAGELPHHRHELASSFSLHRCKMRINDIITWANVALLQSDNNRALWVAWNVNLHFKKRH